MQQVDCHALSTGDQPHWQHPRCKREANVVCKAVKAADFTLLNLEAQLSHTWPAWTQNACRRISQVLSLQLASCMLLRSEQLSLA